MSVYTPLSRDDLAKIVDSYSLGNLHAFEGIKAGVTNTIYKLDTQQGFYVLTLFEHTAKQDLPFYVELMRHFFEAGLPCQHPIANSNGDYINAYAAKPYVLCPYLQGDTLTAPNDSECRQLGELVARMHLLGVGYQKTCRNPRGLSWCMKTYLSIKHKLKPEQRRLIESELKRHARIRYEKLPQGIIHGDLFRDNVIFKDGKLTGIIDFYYACNDVLIIDIANVINDWCLSQRSSAQTLVNATLDGYNAVRKLDVAERKLFPEILCLVALRYWLSRLQDAFRYHATDNVQIKDPHEYEVLLNLHRSRCR